MTAQHVVEREHTSIEHHETGSGAYSGASTKAAARGQEALASASVSMYVVCIYVCDSLRKRSR